MLMHFMMFHMTFISWSMQASRAVSFLNHLIIIQQSQRAAAYGFSKQLKCLRECTYAFENSYVKCTDIDERTSSEYSIVQNQHAFFQCMWKQKVSFHFIIVLALSGLNSC
jgi:midasin